MQNYSYQEDSTQIDSFWDDNTSPQQSAGLRTPSSGFFEQPEERQSKIDINLHLVQKTLQKSIFLFCFAEQIEEHISEIYQDQLQLIDKISTIT
uniref:Uncharacterized protein n=1 Tax=Spironucleus salmonicida TaxID=348837 RepID=V6LJM6_9EUKA|eukprot:EST44727.1 Hypothetical protein SS50377_15380 [Spironucleus salmonicida]